MTNNVVVFDPNEFREVYPNFANFTDTQLEFFFAKAEVLFNNTERSCIKDLKRRKLLMFLIVAHLAQLQGNIDNGNTIVGRVSSATQGSVSVSMDYGTSSGSSKWWEQTPYGAEYWQLTAQYRSGLNISVHQSMPVNRTRNRYW